LTRARRGFEDYLAIRDRPIRALTEPDLTDSDWDSVGVDVVIEATGSVRTREQAATHLSAGARKVVLSAPGTDVDETIAMGINQDAYDAMVHDVISNASCTTNCAAPMAQVLHQAFGIEEGLLTTVHSYTADQPTRRDSQGPAPGPLGGGQHHPDHDRRGAGHRDRAAGAGRLDSTALRCRCPSSTPRWST
jgi:glyceraldehyde-3-phosphate dehydrogenase type I